MDILDGPVAVSGADALPPFEGKRLRLAQLEFDFERHIRLFARFVPVGPGTRILDIGCGSGWFPVLCRRNGIACRGIEVRPHMVDYGRELGRRLGAEADIVCGDVQTMDYGREAYDIVIATSVFEHLPAWRRVVASAFRALRPGGLLYVYASNKFSPLSGECAVPLYGWLPREWRRRLRVRREGGQILRWGGFDWNQFTYPELRAAFRRAGFSRVLDPVDLLDPDRLGLPRWWKIAILRFLKRSRWLRDAALLVVEGTQFVCLKGR
jgi:SAM-dependent methyltransferase